MPNRRCPDTLLETPLPELRGQSQTRDAIPNRRLDALLEESWEHRESENGKSSVAEQLVCSV